VPGVTSALAAPVCAGIPITHRRLASSVAIVAGHCARGDRRPLTKVAHADTLVILMGARSLPGLVAELLAAGRSPATPAAFLSRASRKDQTTVRARLGELCSEVARAGAVAPAVIVVGEVAAPGERLGPLGDGDIFDGAETESDNSVD
jgi:siroheme synthase